jgi:hypothetical protein
MPNVKSYETKAKTWATGHIVAAAIICLAVGFALGALLT